MSEVSSKLDKEKVFNNRRKVLVGKGGILVRGGEFEKKCERHKCHPKKNLCRKSNRTMGECSKIGGMDFGKRWGGGRISRKICRCHKCHPKMNLCRKFHPNRTIENSSKLGEKLEMD